LECVEWLFKELTKSTHSDEVIEDKVIKDVDNVSVTESIIIRCNGHCGWFVSEFINSKYVLLTLHHITERRHSASLCCG
jgi:hypothetical protein